MDIMKKGLLMILLFFAFLAGCEKDSALPKNASETMEDATERIEDAKNENPSTHEEVTPEKNEDMQGVEPKDKTEPVEKNGNSDQKEKASKEDKIKSSTTDHLKKENQQSKGKETKADTDKKSPIENKGTINTDYVTVSIKGLDGNIILPSITVFIEPDDTVLSATAKILKEKGIQFEYRGSGDAAYMEGIDNLYEMDHGPLSGWLFKKNGKVIGRSSGSEPVKNGDEIEWIYSLDMTAN